MIYLLFTIVGFGLGFWYCNMSYIRYKETRDAIDVVNNYEKNKRRG